MTDVCRACACRPGRHQDRATCRPCALTPDDIPGLRRRIAGLTMRLYWRTRDGINAAGGGPGPDANDGGRSNVRSYDNLQPHRQLIGDGVRAARVLGVDAGVLWTVHERLERALGLADEPLRMELSCLACGVSWSTSRQTHGLLGDSSRTTAVWCTGCGARWTLVKFRAARNAARYEAKAG